MSKNKAYKIIESIVIFVIGLLLTLSILNESFINYIIGAIVILLGILAFVKGVSDSSRKTVLLPASISGAILVATGISIMANYINITSIIMNLIAIILITIGALFIIDSIIRFVNKNTNLGICEIVFGIIGLTFGIVFLFWRQYIWIIFGVLLMIYGLYNLILTLISLKSRK